MSDIFDGTSNTPPDCQIEPECDVPDPATQKQSSDAYGTKSAISSAIDTMATSGK